MDVRTYIIILFYLSINVYGEDVTNRTGNVLSVFQVVKFRNEACTGSTKNGTCLTSQECTQISGTSQGSCADGFGVCCTVTLALGGKTQTSSVNNTYIELDSSADVGAHTFTICPCSDNICRIKFDFESFTLASPHTGAGYYTDTGAPVVAAGATMIGDCSVDTFQITTPSGRGSPTICGVNSNQHMFIDHCSSECQTVNLGIGGSTSATRALDIRVIQYACGDEQGGPPGCLQYYENESGKIRSFNFADQTPGTAIGYDGPVHLSNQHYKICMRRGANKEIICYTPCTDTAGNAPAANNMVIAQPSFGLSIQIATAAAEGLNDSDCANDYITIVLGGLVDSAESEFDSTNAQQDKLTVVASQVSKFCGRYFVTQTEAAFTAQSICSFTLPFEVGVDFDENEICSANTNGKTCESVGTASTPGGSGSLGFSLCYVQHTPPIG